LQQPSPLAGAGKKDEPMDINADFSKRAAVHAARLPWVPSPVNGVDRRMLDRVGDEGACHVNRPVCAA
jgi:hypothetical protein